ncbi:MAG: DedA family protein [Myxococcota bacterium]
MKAWLIALLGSTTGLAAYGLVFAILLAAGFGLPLPEDIPLVMGGVLVHRGQADLLTMIVVGYLGIIVGDSIMFGLGRRFGSRVGKLHHDGDPPVEAARGAGFLGRIITPASRARVEGMFKKHGEKIVMVARFLPGIRTVTYFTAGAVGMSFARFALYDSIAALASAPIFVLLGWKFGANIEELLARVAAGERNVMIALVALIVAGILFGRWRSKREQRANAEALAKQEALEASQPPKIS